MLRTPARSQIGVGLVILFLALSLFYLGLNIVQMRPPAGSARTEALHGVLTGPDPRTLAAEDMTAVSLPHRAESGSVFADYRFIIDDPAALGPEPAILIPTVALQAAVLVDGKLVGALGRIARSPSVHEMRPLLFRLPQDLRAGAVLDVIAIREAGQPALWPIHLGRHDQLYHAYLKQKRLRGDIPEGVAGVGCFVAALCVAAASLFTSRGLMFSLAGVGGGWSVMLTANLVSDLAASLSINQRMLDALYFSAFFFALTMLLIFFVEWTSVFDRRTPLRPPRQGVWRFFTEPWSGRERAMLWRVGGGVAAFGAIGATTFLFWPGQDDRQFVLADVVTWLALPAILFMVARIVSFYGRGVRGRILELAAFFVVVAAALCDVALVLIWREQGVFLNVATVFFLFALTLTMASRAQGIFAAATASNARLESMVAEREAQLLEGLAALRERDKEATRFEERTRIMRDMHDGVGGQLLSLLMRMRGRSADGRGVDGRFIQNEIESIVSDLRLMIDSLDSVGDSLDIALASFQERIKPQIEAAGILLDWENALIEPALGFQPGDVLQIYRILQEAVTNAVRHSGATRISIRVEREHAAQPLIRVTVSDNGKGIGTACAPGRGLANMRARAERIGARVHLNSSDKGTNVELFLNETLDR